jgi:hypothetical protein
MKSIAGNCQLIYGKMGEKSGWERHWYQRREMRNAMLSSLVDLREQRKSEGAFRWQKVFKD